MTSPAISAYIPCFNNAATLGAAIDSIRHQSVAVAEMFVIDDGSTDGSCTVAERMGVRVIRNRKNQGRGAVRARAMQEVSHDLVLSCDSTNALPREFCERALPWFESEKVAAVFGRMSQTDNRSVVSRWRGRHLFKVDACLSVNRRASLSTGGVMMRRPCALGVGNFAASLRHSEDADLGGRLLAAEYEVVFDPKIHITSLGENTVTQVLERYWRWYAGKEEHVTWKSYLKLIIYAFKGMAVRDLRARDPLSVPISLFCPHYQFWKSYLRSRYLINDCR